MPLVYSNRYKLETGRAGINLNTDSVRCILMQSGFTFNPDTHSTYADVSASELAAGSGYTATGQVVTITAGTQDNANDRANWPAAAVVWTASGGSIGPAAGALYYDDTHANDVVIGYGAFTSALTATNGNTFTVNATEFRVA